jgi:SAM-dependent methyltransferase
MDPEIKKRFTMVIGSKTFHRIARILNFSNKRVLDMGCGFGEYMQRMRKDSVGITTNPDEVEFGKVNNIDLRIGNVEKLKETIKPGEKFDVFWGNNLFEHLLSPHSFLVHMKEFSTPDTRVVLGVPVVPKIELLMKLKKYRGPLASPHVNFFTKRTLALTVQYAGWEVEQIRPFIFSNQFLDALVSNFAPHMYVVAKNIDEYKYPPKKMKEWVHDPLYQDLIKIMHKTG